MLQKIDNSSLDTFLKSGIIYVVFLGGLLLRILLFSDTHDDINLCIKAIEKINKVDVIIHLGDNKKDADDIQSIFPNIKHFSVLGNNDFDSFGKYQDEIITDGYKFFITHGHTYDVKRGLSKLIDKAKACGCDVACFGHTHKSIIKYVGSITLINPGSARAIFGGSYGIIEIEDGKINCSILEMEG